MWLLQRHRVLLRYSPSFALSSQLSGVREALGCLKLPSGGASEHCVHRLVCGYTSGVGRIPVNQQAVRRKGVAALCWEPRQTQEVSPCCGVCRHPGELVSNQPLSRRGFCLLMVKQL